MTVRTETWMVAAALLLASLPASAVVLTGKVRTQGAQAILAPASLTSPVTLRFYVPDGTKVEKGQPILRIDASSASGMLKELHNKITLAKATNAKKLAALQLKVIDAQLALVDAVAARDKAAVDAALPKSLVSGLDYDRYQGTYKSDKRDATLKQKELAAAQAAVTRQRHNGALDIKKLKTKLDFREGQVQAATVLAKRDGTVVHGFQHLVMMGQSGGRFRQGSMCFPGTRVGEVVGPGSGHSVRAWALQPDRRGLKKGQTVRVHFDALPKADVTGHITSISNAAQSRSSWGDGHYYQIDIALDAAAEKLPLLPGMSVRVQTDVKKDHEPPSTHRAQQRVLQATGEVVALKNRRIVTPKIPGVWQLNITHMAADGTVVKKGQPLVTFAAGTLAQKLPSMQSKLKESQRARDQLRLKLADDKRKAEVAVAKAKADAEKARRKANEPEKYIPGIEYKKLVIDRRRMQKRLKLTRHRNDVAAASRQAQMAVANAKVAQAKRKVTRMQQSMASLTVHAPRSGMFLHEVKYDGSKVDVGTQVFFGQTVGTMPDLHSLAVRAELPERDLRRVHVGQAVQVILSGGASRTVDGHIAGIGRNVHSKSDAEPEPVVDLKVSLDDDPGGIKPGRSVRVDILPSSGAAS